MSEIDDKIVSITFDNDNFEKKLAQTIVSLDDLSEAIRMTGAKEGLSELGDAADSFDLSGMAEAVDNISSKFSVLGAVGFSVIQDLTRSAMDFVTRVLDKVSEPILVGGKNRAQNIEQAKFLFRGLGMDIEDTMASAKEAVLGTAFGLDAAAKAAAQLGGSGLKAGAEMTGTLRGIAGLAAMSGSSFEEMADIFVSAAGKGTVSGYELQRIAFRGINAAAVLGKQMGKTEAEIRSMASEGKITFKDFAAAMDKAFGEHATKANETYTGSLANMRAAFSRMGAVFFGPNLEQQRDLFNAITPKVDELTKALNPLIMAFVNIKRLAINNLINIFKGLDLSKLTFMMPTISKGVIDLFITFNQVITSIKDAFKDVFPVNFGNTIVVLAMAFKKFTEWVKMGGTTVAMLTSVFHGVFAAIAIVIEVVKNVAILFKDLFMVVADAVGADGNGILRWFAHMGEALFDLKKVLVDGGGIADFFDTIKIAIATFMEEVKNFEGPFEFLQRVKDIVMNMFDGSEGIPGADKAGSAVGRVSDRIDMLRESFRKIGKFIDRVKQVLDPVIRAIDFIWESLKSWFTELGQKLSAVMDAGDFNALVDMLNVALLGGILGVLRKFSNGSLSLLNNGFMDRIKGILEGVTDTLKAMQLELKAKALLKIAYALGIMTISIVALSLIDSVALTKALTAITVAFGQLAGMMKLMDEIVSDPRSAAKIGILAASLILLATAMGILSISIKILSDLGWEELAKGLVGVGGGLALMINAMNLITKDPEGLIRTGISMIGIAIALRILANAMQAFATMDWGEMAKGLVGVGGGLAFLVNAMNKIDAKDMISAGLGIIAISVGMRILANAMQAFATMSWGEIAKGLIAVGASLGIIVLLTNTMPAGGLVGIGVGLIGVSIALRIMGEAIQKMGEMDLGTLAKGIGAIAATMLILAVATNAMSGALPGAAALIVVSGALLILANVLKEIGNLSLKEIAVGLGGIVAVLLVLGIAAAALEVVLPAMIGLGVALALIGGGFALFGVGAIMVAKAIETLAKSGKAGLQALQDAILILAENMPKMIGAIAQGFIEGSQEILHALPTLIDTIKVLLSHILDTIIELAPKIGEALGAITTAGLDYLEQNFPKFVDTGIKMIRAILDGMSANTEEFTQKAIDILIKFLETITENMQDLVDAGVDMVLALIQGIGERADDLAMAGLDLLIQILRGISEHILLAIDAAVDIVENLLLGLGTASVRLIAAGANLVIQILAGITQNVIRVANAFTNMAILIVATLGNNATRFTNAGTNVLVKFLFGISNNVSKVVGTVTTVITKFITEVGKSSNKIVTAGTDAIIAFLNGVQSNSKKVIDKFAETGVYIMETLAKKIIFTVDKAGKIIVQFMNALSRAIDEHAPEIRKAGRKLAGSFADAMTGGLASRVGDFFGFGEHAASETEKGYLNAINAHSPSRRFMEIAGYIASGLRIGFDKDTSVERSMSAMAERAKNGFQSAFERLAAIVPSIGDTNPVITPVLDLSLVRAKTKDLDNLMSGSTITPDVSLDRARTLSLVSNDQNGSEPEPVVQHIEQNFNQTINAPTALSVNDIYRTTKSQFALAKEELGVA